MQMTEDQFYGEFDYRQELYDIHDGRLDTVIETLRAATNSRLRYPFRIISSEQPAIELAGNPELFERAVLRVATEPKRSHLDRSIRRALFGYIVQGQFRRIGPINFVVIDGTGHVVDMGFANHLLLQHFKYHLYGRNVSPEKAERLIQIQEAVFAYLRSSSACQERLAQFVASRGWPEGLAESAQLVYFDSRLVDLQDWASAQGFKAGDMCQAGWFEMNFSQQGELSYSVRDSDVIRIPYFHKGRIVSWRTRHLNPIRAETHKYTSWPLDRSVHDWREFETKLYFQWRLSEAQGNPIIITEGEFKCLVTTHIGKILTVGIPGITEVDDKTIQMLVEAHGSEYLVILDRDPFGKGAMRVDGITDSERASYLIALRLQRTGAQNVRVGVIPAKPNGEKVGLDDLILESGAEALKAIIDQATIPSLYAEKVGLDEQLCDILLARQQLKKVLEDYRQSFQRGGTAVAQEVVAQAEYIQGEVETLYRTFLLQELRGARRLNQPMRHFTALFQVQSLLKPDYKMVLLENGKELPLHYFCNDIIVLKFHLQDTPVSAIWALDPYLTLEFSQSDIHSLATTGKTVNSALIATAEVGASVLGVSLPKLLGTSTVHDLATVVMAGHLARWFPGDEHIFQRNVSFCILYPEYVEELIRIPLIVFRKASKMAVVVATCAIWENGQGVRSAIDLASQKVNLATWFLRGGDAPHSYDKYTMVIETLWPYWFNRNLRVTEELVAPLGITPETVAARQLLALLPEDIEELINHFFYRRLLNQATYVGLFRRNPYGMVEPRFQGAIVLFPVIAPNGTICGLRVLPTELADYHPPALPPLSRLVHYLYGSGRQLLPELDPEQHLYLEQNLRRVRVGGNLLVTFHELDGLALASATTPVVSLNSSLRVGPQVMERLIASQAASLYVVISLEPTSPYDVFAFDGVAGYLKELYDLQEQLNSMRPPEQKTLSTYVVVLGIPLTNLVAVSDAQSCAEQLISQAVELTAYLQSYQFDNVMHSTVRRFLKISTRLMDYLEISALPDLLDGKPVEWYVKETRRLYTAIQAYALSKHKRKLPSIEVYFQGNLGLEATQSLEELLKQRKENNQVFIRKPVYSPVDPARHAAQVPSAYFRRLYEVTIVNLDINRPIANTLQVQDHRPILTSDNPKVSVLEYLQSRLHAQPQPTIQFTLEMQGFKCQVSIAEGTVIHRGTGLARNKRDAEIAAYEMIWRRITTDEVPEQPTTIAQADEAARIRTLLTIPPGEQNYVGLLYRLAQAVGLTGPEFTTTKVTTADTQAFSTIVRVSLPNERVPLESDESISTIRQQSRQAAAGDLLNKIWAHYA